MPKQDRPHIPGKISKIMGANPGAGVFAGVTNIREDGNLIWSNADILWGTKTTFFNSSPYDELNVHCSCGETYKMVASKLFNTKTTYESLYCRKCYKYQGIKTKGDLTSLVIDNDEYFKDKTEFVKEMLDKLPEKVEDKPISGGINVHIH